MLTSKLKTLQLLPLSKLLLCCLLAHGNSSAADQHFTAVFAGTGRACSGNLYLYKKTIEWNTTYSICKPTAYTVLANELDSNSPRLVVQLKHKSSKCHQQVLALSPIPSQPFSWDVQGFASLADYENREDAAAKARTLMCPMIKRDQL